MHKLPSFVNDIKAECSSRTNQINQTDSKHVHTFQQLHNYIIIVFHKHNLHQESVCIGYYVLCNMNLK